MTIQPIAGGFSNFLVNATPPPGMIDPGLAASFAAAMQNVQDRDRAAASPTAIPRLLHVGATLTVKEFDTSSGTPVLVRITRIEVDPQRFTDSEKLKAYLLMLSARLSALIADAARDDQPGRRTSGELHLDAAVSKDAEPLFGLVLDQVRKQTPVDVNRFNARPDDAQTRRNAMLERIRKVGFSQYVREQQELRRMMRAIDLVEAQSDPGVRAELKKVRFRLKMDPPDTVQDVAAHLQEAIDRLPAEDPDLLKLRLERAVREIHRLMDRYDEDLARLEILERGRLAGD